MSYDSQALHAYLEVGTHQAYVAVSENEGVSITGLLEAIGRDLPAVIAARPELIRQARKVDAIRRRRVRPGVTAR